MRARGYAFPRGWLLGVEVYRDLRRRRRQSIAEYDSAEKAKMI